MESVLLTAHVLIALSLVGAILLQRSEGGALGIGGPGDSMFRRRGSADLLTRATAALAAMFFVTSLSLTLIARSSATLEEGIVPAPVSESADDDVPRSVLPDLPRGPSP